MPDKSPRDLSGLHEDFEDFFEESLCGYVIASPEGIILRANQPLATWMNTSPDALAGRRVSDLLTIGGKIYYETHLWPLLRMQGYFDEIALELALGDGRKLPVLANAIERRHVNGEAGFIRLSIFQASDRRTYEQNLKDKNAGLEANLATAGQISVLREQFIAILGHDLRNPLGSIKAGSSLLARASLPPMETKVVELIRNSALRIEELIENIMDFARTRLGQGLVLDLQPTDLTPVLMHVVNELQAIHPDRAIKTELDLSEPVTCDASRIGQLLSNLLANALTHGSADYPVQVNARNHRNVFELAVCNKGIPITPEQIPHLFEPFTRETARPSANGLGLGLYISSQIAGAHGGTLTATSTMELTCFTLNMPYSSATI